MQQGQVDFMGISRSSISISSAASAALQAQINTRTRAIISHDARAVKHLLFDFRVGCQTPLTGVIACGLRPNCMAQSNLECSHRAQKALKNRVIMPDNFPGDFVRNFLLLGM